VRLVEVAAGHIIAVPERAGGAARRSGLAGISVLSCRVVDSPRILVSSPAASERLLAAHEFLASRRRDEQVLILGTTMEAPRDLARVVALERGGSFGWHRLTLGRLAAIIAAPLLAVRGAAPVGRLALEALCARVVFRLAGTAGAQGLGRFAPVADRPGLPRALEATFQELRLEGKTPRDLSSAAGTPAGAACADLASLLDAYEAEVAEAGLADRALVLSLALERLRGGAGHPLVGLPLVLLDLPCARALERDLCLALIERAPAVLATVPAGDERSRAELSAVLEVAAVTTAPSEDRAPSSLRRLQFELFGDARGEPGPPGTDVVVLSAPGESRECVEIARLLHREADRGVPFDRMAVLLRAPVQYRSHLEEALRRAGIEAHFERGTRRPDPAGRALLALLACAAEGLSARRFAEYLSLGQVPDATIEGAPPSPTEQRWIPPDEEMLPGAVARGGDDAEETAPDSEVLPAAPDSTSTIGGTLRAPRNWERLLVDAAVIGGRDRWCRRLDGLERELELDLGATDDGDEAAAARIHQRLASLRSLRAYAVPLLDALVALPQEARWGEWLVELRALVPRALRRPDRVLAVLAELAPMASVGPVDLGEVRLVLHERLADLVAPPAGRRAGRVFVAPIDAARGLSFDVVFVPGLAEKVFPQKVTEDPILRDVERRLLGLDTNEERIAAERLALHLAVGAARSRLVLSYPRVDMDQSRPRVPSFYGLEVLRAAEGKLPGFDDLARRAEQAVPGASRLGWPAPQRPDDAIDEAEHDLSLLSDLFGKREDDTVGTARYLLGANPHLARALRFRARRWLKSWRSPDGLVDPIPEARAALARHRLDARSFSATALQHFATCPYKFFLNTVHRLSPREVPAAIDEISALQRGSLVHEIQFELQSALRDEGLLPITAATATRALGRLDEVIDRVAQRTKDELAPAIDRVWEDGIAAIRADLREWLRRAENDPTWTPWLFELSFGLSDRRPEDPHSQDAAVALDCGIQLRGSIDLVERREGGALRATDHKTGKVRAQPGSVVGGGETLQPVLYALALEKLFPDARVEAGRLYYCTAAGGFTEVTIPLDPLAREHAKVVAETIGEALESAFLPAAPKAGACRYCEYNVVCGPYEELRTTKYKVQDRLLSLRKLRALP